MIAAISMSSMVASVAFAEDPCIKIRAAFDIGSSATKTSVFKINACKRRIVEKLYPADDNQAEQDASVLPINFKDELDNGVNKALSDGDFDPSAFPYFRFPFEKKAKETLLAQKQMLATRFNPSDFIAVATQAFRESQNSKNIIDFLNSNGFKALTIMQEQEAMIEWGGSVASMKNKMDVDDNDVVSWGIGGGSMQFGAKSAKGKNIPVITQYGSDPMYTKSKDALGKQKLLPISKDQITTLVDMVKRDLSYADDAFRDRFGEGVTTVGVGGVINIGVKQFLSIQLAKSGMNPKTSFFSREDIKAALDLIANQPADSAIWGVEDISNPKAPKPIKEKYREATVSNLALVYGAMLALNIPSVKYSDVNNTYGAPFAPEFKIKVVPRPKPKPMVKLEGKKTVKIEGVEKQVDIYVAPEEAPAPQGEPGVRSSIVDADEF